MHIFSGKHFVRPIGQLVPYRETIRFATCLFPPVANEPLVSLTFGSTS